MDTESFDKGRNALKAKEIFEKAFQKKVPEYTKTASYKHTLLEVVATQVKSKSEAKRLIASGAVDINEITITNNLHKMKGGEKVKIGKKIFILVDKK